MPTPRPPDTFPALSPRAWEAFARSLGRIGGEQVERLLAGAGVGRDARLLAITDSLRTLYGLTRDEAHVAAVLLDEAMPLFRESLSVLLSQADREAASAVAGFAEFLAAAGAPVTVNPAAVEAIAARTQAAITNDWSRLPDTFTRRITDTLNYAVTTGSGSREAARLMVEGVEDAVGFTHGRAMTIARTEIADAYARAATDLYRGSDLVVGWRWVATDDGTTCPACLILDGQVFATEDEMDRHHNCRCTSVPVLAGDEPVIDEQGYAEGHRQDRDVILARLPKSWEPPDDLRTLVGTRDNPGWRPSRVLVKPT